MKNGNAASTPKDLDVKPTALSMLLDAIGAVGGLVRAYASKDDAGDDWLEWWFLKRTQLHCAAVIPEDEQVVPIALEATHVPQLSQRPGLSLVSIRPHKRFARWADRGIWELLHQHFADDPDMEYLIIDSTVVRAHPCAAGAPQKKVAKQPRLWDGAAVGSAPRSM